MHSLGLLAPQFLVVCAYCLGICRNSLVEFFKEVRYSPALVGEFADQIGVCARNVALTFDCIFNSFNHFLSFALLGGCWFVSFLPHIGQ